jgi:hypothetical protein
MARKCQNSIFFRNYNNQLLIVAFGRVECSFEEGELTLKFPSRFNHYRVVIAIKYDFLAITHTLSTLTVQ